MDPNYLALLLLQSNQQRNALPTVGTRDAYQNLLNTYASTLADPYPPPENLNSILRQGYTTIPNFDPRAIPNITARYGNAADMALLNDSIADPRSDSFYAKCLLNYHPIPAGHMLNSGMPFYFLCLACEPLILIII
jgi:hypothetical protein